MYIFNENDTYYSLYFTLLTYVCISEFYYMWYVY